MFCVCLVKYIINVHKAVAQLICPAFVRSWDAIPKTAGTDWVWWYIPIIPELGRLKQDYKPKTGLGCIIRPRVSPSLFLSLSLSLLPHPHS